MKYNPNIQHRQSIRLKGYDYSSEGAYFITICTQNIECSFGEIVDGKMELNNIGRIVENEWLKTSIIRKNVVLDEFIIMPDHMHGIVVINESHAKNNVGAYCIRPTCIRPTSIRPTSTPLTPELCDKDVCLYECENEECNGMECINWANKSRAYINCAINDRAYINNIINDRAYINTPLQSTSQTIGAIVRGFKSSTTKQINILQNSPSVPVWQRNYYDEIIRNEKQLNNIRKYIIDNPIEWEMKRKSLMYLKNS